METTERSNKQSTERSFWQQGATTVHGLYLLEPKARGAVAVYDWAPELHGQAGQAQGAGPRQT